GIYKYPIESPILLERETVKNDIVSDRKHHGGEYKACYLFPKEEYGFWKPLYPDFDWKWGAFGENLTVEGLNETLVRIGSIYQIGKATVQITEPRQPCFKLGIRFGDQDILKKFVDHGRTGTYVRILEEGEVRTGDVLNLIEESESPLTIQQYHRLITVREKDQELLKLAVANDSIRRKKRDMLKKYIL
ncbi:MAG: MOSC domain-containing protein, partial [Flavobacteriaceae bacterium]